MLQSRQLLTAPCLTLAQGLVRENLLASPHSTEDSSKTKGRPHSLTGLPMSHRRTSRNIQSIKREHADRRMNRWTRVSYTTIL